MKRYLSLDVLRGLTVAMMIMVNNPGSWSCSYHMMQHCPWDGCTPCDLVFPFFLFCVGTSMAFAFAKYASLTGEALKKIFKRGILLYLAGLLLTAFPFYNWHPDPELSFGQNWLQWARNLRLVSVLARIAMCYVAGSVLVLWLKTPKKLLSAVAVLSVLHVGLLLLFAGPEGAFSLEGNYGRRFDIAILGEGHVYTGYGIPFDPEGFFGALTGTCTVILGYLAGNIIRNSAKRYAESGLVEDSPVGVTAKIFALSVASLLFGLVLSIWIPINKPLWSVSYVFYAAGWAAMALALFIYLIDVKGWEKPFLPFKALGMNALSMFLLSCFLQKVNSIYIGWDYPAIFGVSENMSLLFAFMYMVFHLGIAMVLYKKKIFIKL